MTHNDFEIGKEFQCGEKRFRCTDVGTRVIVAICIDKVEYVRHPERYTATQVEAMEEGWFDGPPYAVAEEVFDENDMPECEEITATDARVPGAGKDQVVDVAPDFDKGSQIVF